MNEYRMTFAVGLHNKTWFEEEVTVLNDDEGDARAVEMGEAQLRNTYEVNMAPVVFITLIYFQIIEDVDDEEDDPVDWELCKFCHQMDVVSETGYCSSCGKSQEAPVDGDGV